MESLCSEGCGRPIRSRGLCKPHYGKFYYSRNRDKILSVNKTYYLENKDKIVKLQKISRKTLNGRWDRLRSDAKRDSRNLTLSKEEFALITSLPCNYCGDMNKDQNYVGVDRLDNSKGYEPGNSVPCCTTCNMMKRDMTTSEWLVHMKKVLSFSKRTS